MSHKRAFGAFIRASVLIAKAAALCLVAISSHAQVYYMRVPAWEGAPAPKAGPDDGNGCFYNPAKGTYAYNTLHKDDYDYRIYYRFEGLLLYEKTVSHLTYNFGTKTVGNYVYWPGELKESSSHYTANSKYYEICRAYIEEPTYRPESQTGCRSLEQGSYVYQGNSSGTHHRAWYWNNLWIAHDTSTYSMSRLPTSKTTGGYNYTVGDEHPDKPGYFSICREVTEEP